MLGTSSRLPGKSSATFGYLWKSSGNVQERSYGRRILGESSEIFEKCSEIFGKSSKISLSVCLCNRQDNAWLLVDMYYPLHIIFQKSLAPLVVLFSSEQNQFTRLQTHAQIS